MQPLFGPEHNGVGCPFQNPTVEISLDYLKLEPIGFVFIIFFAVVIMIQIIGMLIHRFETLSHIVSDTRMQLFPAATNKAMQCKSSAIKPFSGQL